MPNNLTRKVWTVGASESGVIEAGACGVFFRCTSGTASITPVGGGTVNLSSPDHGGHDISIYNFEYLPPYYTHGAIAYSTDAASGLEITEDR